MKYIKAFVCILLVCAVLSGCSFHISSSVDELIAPISPFGENADVKNALDSYAKNGYTLKTPSFGDFISAYNFYDIDSDGVDEAFAFYEPSDDLGTIDMAVIKNLGGKDGWSVVANVKGDGKDIYSISFDDVNNDSNMDILICWDAISNSSNHVLSVYRYVNSNSDLSLKQIGTARTINNYICVDLNGDGKNELLVFEISSVSSSVKAQLYSLYKNDFKLVGETKLDSHITAYTSIDVENTNGTVRVYADAIGSDGSSMLTEIICWSDSYSTIISPFYSYSTGLTKSTNRSAMLSCKDVNDDDLIEIPVDYSLKKLPSQVLAVDWQVYKKSILIHSLYSLFAKNDSYMVIIPDNIINNIRVKYDENTSCMTVKNKTTKNDVFSIMPVLKASYDESKYTGYSIVLEKSGYYYLAKIGDDTDIKITINDLKNNIRSVD